MIALGPAGLDEVRAFLRAVGLPHDDLGLVAAEVRVARRDGRLVGTVAVERYGSHGLLRSLAVAPDQRGLGLGGRLADDAEAVGRALGLHSMVLLTETAAPFFEARGYVRVPRSEVPEAVRQSGQFRGACCASAVCMRMLL